MTKQSTIMMCLAALVGAVIITNLHVDQKWDAAFIGTLAAFWYLAGVFKSRWGHFSFWTAFVGCFIAHLAMIWFVFARLMRNITVFGIYEWIPIGMIEGIGLYYVMDFLDRTLSNDKRPQ